MSEKLFDGSHGLLVYRASRLEELVPPMLSLLKAVPASEEHLLVKQTVLVAHAGMRNWLTSEVARLRFENEGSRAVVADLDLVLFSSWMDRLAKQVLGDSAVSIEEYQHARLRWTVYRVLGDVRPASLDLSNEQRRMQVAGRLAGLFSQYIIYRPDWLATWERGEKVPIVDDGNPLSFVGEVWREVHARIGKPYRAQVQKELIKAIAAGQRTASVGQDDAAIVHVFGANHMSAGDLRLLQAIARHRIVVMYVPDPSAQRWQEVNDDQRAAMKLKDAELTEEQRNDLELQLLDAPHPLLAKWARLGQHFFARLESVDAMFDTRHHLDQAKFEVDGAFEPTTRLENLQESFRRYDASLLTREFSDRSLLVHSCHTPLRELEVLRNALLDALVADPTLRPEEILVVAPNIGDYAALIPAVFGAPGKYDTVLPYTMNDVPLSRSHALVEWLQTLLSVPQERMTAAKVLQLLRNPSVLKALDLNETQVGDIEEFLLANHVAWGFDAEDRGRYGVPALAVNTLAWGFDRLLTAQVFGAARSFDDGVVFDGVMAAESKYRSGATDFAWAGALDQLLVKMFGFNEFARASHTVKDWLKEISAVIGPLVESHDETSRTALREINTIFADLDKEAGENSPIVNYSVLHDLLIGKLERLDTGQFVGGSGVTFAGMVPQRSIPFQMIAVLGLNAGDFPRAVTEDGLDFMVRFPRVGDREVRMDDRYLFLETIMSARKRLHLSYVGESASDGKERNPALPLAELMNELPKSANGGKGAWFVKHPLQPFDRRYFSRDLSSELISFDAPPERVESPVLVRRATLVDAMAKVLTPLDVKLEDVVAYYRDPARHIARQRFDQFEVIDVQDFSALEEEPLDPGFDARLRMNWMLFLKSLGSSGGAPLSGSVPAWLHANGMTAQGDFVAASWSSAVTEAQEAILAMALPALSSTVQRTAVDLDLDGFHLTGSVDAYPDSQGGLHLLVPAFKAGKSVDKLSMKELLTSFVQWASLRLQEPKRVVKLYTVSGDGNSLWAEKLNSLDNDALDDLRMRLTQLIRYYATPDRLYFPKTSWAATFDEDKANGAWMGSDFSTGELQYSPHAQLLFGDIDLSRRADDRRVLLEDARFLFEKINIDHVLAKEPKK